MRFRRGEQADLDPILTTRETEVLTLLSEGASNKEIARRLNISVHNAKFHIGQILDKLRRHRPDRRCRACRAARRP